MGRKYVRIADLQSGTKVEACFLLHNFQLRPKKDGSNFATMALKDATGKVTAIMWDNFDGLASGAIKENDFVEVTGEVLTYNNQLQFKVSRLVRVPDSEVDASFFLPVCPVPVPEMEAELKGLIAGIKDKDYRRITECVFSSRDFMERFRRAPSGVSMHQAYLGGLLEHTLCVTRNALKIAENYPAANRCLLTAGALLHDMGKVVEFVYDKKLAYSDVGRLLGHISIGNAMLEVHCSHMPDFPMAKKVLVQHLILSHHGLLEYGSPKCPSTLEALILHHADQLDAQLSNYVEYLGHARKAGIRWEYSNMFERQMFGGTGEVIENCDLVRDLTYSDPREGSDTLAGAIPSDELLRSFAK